MADDSSSPGILESMLMAAKKLPGQTVGAGVDLTNLFLGGAANIVEAAQGKEITRQVGEGLVPKPVGGSASLNSFFGLDKPSTGLVEDSTSAVLGALTPGKIVAGASKALIVAATAIKSPQEIAAAKSLLQAGVSAKEVFEKTGIYKGPIDGQLRAVLDDSKIQVRNLERLPGSNVTTADGTLSQTLDHPELFKAYPELKDALVGNDPGKGIGAATAYMPTPDHPGGIVMGTLRSISDLKSTLLHETQHLIQGTEGFMGGGSPSNFLPGGFDKAFAKIQSVAGDLKRSVATKFGLTEDQVAAMALSGKAPKDIAASDEFKTYLKTRNAQAVGLSTMDKAYKSYETIAGEAEARAVQRAFEIGQNGQAGKIFFPLDLYDVRTQDLIANPLDSKLKARP